MHSRIGGGGGGRGGAGPAGEAEGLVHDGWAEAPLGHGDPPDGGEAIAEEGAGLRGALQMPDVEEEGKGGPQPAPLDEEDVEDVAFLAEVGGRGGVGRGEVREEGAADEGQWVDGHCEDFDDGEGGSGGRGWGWR